MPTFKLHTRSIFIGKSSVFKIDSWAPCLHNYVSMKCCYFCIVFTATGPQPYFIEYSSNNDDVTALLLNDHNRHVRSTSTIISINILYEAMFLIKMKLLIQILIIHLSTTDKST